MAWKIYTEVDSADTCRDPSDIHVTELGYRNELEDALKLANDFIKKRFLHKETEISKCKDGTYRAVDFCSYGAEIVVKEVKIQ